MQRNRPLHEVFLHLKTLYLKGLIGFQDIIQTLIRNVIFKNSRYFGKNFEDRDFCPLRIKGVALEHLLSPGKSLYPERAKIIIRQDNLNSLKQQNKE